jgi:molecular chaperone DnaJ
LPEGTQTGTKFRLKGQGVKNVNGYGTGDLYFTVKVEVPRKLNKEQKEMLKKFNESCTEECYEKRKSFFDTMKELFK